MTNYDNFAETFAKSRRDMPWSEIDEIIDHIQEHFCDRDSITIADM